jgi:hypothetical protein
MSRAGPAAQKFLSMVRRSTKQRFVYVVLYLALLVGVWFGASSSRVHSWWAEATKQKLPAAENVDQAIANTNTTSASNTNDATANTNTPVENPAEKNLAVPFTTQAPSGNWDADHEEFCEEAAILMVGRYYQGRGFKDVNDKESALQEIKKWEVENLGFYFDTTAAENAKILEGIYGVKVELLKNPTITQIKTAIAAGHPVIVPSAGRELGNPNFKTPGPIYHNLVIRGYTKDSKFITNDPGTRKGEEYIYDQYVLMAAIHDWVPAGDRKIAANGEVASGQRVVLIVSPATTP